jgi:putative DNA primase/helicase
VASNYDDVRRQLLGAGLLVDELRVTGRVVRCRVEGDREQRGWYALHEIPAREGGSLLVGSYGIWSGNDSGATKIEIRAAELSAEQRDALRARMREDRRRADAARKAEAARAQRRAELVWRKALAAPPDGHPPDYLARKGIGAHGLRYSPSGSLVLAMHDATGRVHGLQFILSRSAHKARIARTGRDKEYWPPGLAKQGHYFLIGAPTRLVLVAEGYATAASLHEATGYPVAVAFDAGNLVPVARALRKRYRDARILLCADDDFATPGNPGISAASAAALEVDGAWIAPVFTDQREVEARTQIAAIPTDAPDYKSRAWDVLASLGIGKATDFNDLHQIEGLLLVRAQIEARIAALGWGRAGPPTRAAQPGGEGRAADDWQFTIDRLLGSYSLIYGTDTVFDAERRMVLGLGPLRAAAGKSLVREWLEHPDRVTVCQDQVGFDPEGNDPRVRCNLWGGWPTAPAAGCCDRLLELGEYLCNQTPGEARGLWEWLLCWLAYPIQHPGAKMATSVLMHGPEGTGKNTFFGAIRRIYGRYGTQFSQVEVESNFNGWASGKLFAIGNEVVSRAELYHIQGRLKSMVTEPEWIINEKMLPARAEANHCNFVFFSNRIDIAKLDRGDRRYCVIWTPAALGEDFYGDVSAEIRAGGVEALHQHLLHLDLGDFGPHAKPPMTTAKADLVELGMDSTERFFRDWLDGALDLPAVACLSDDLYSAYRTWCQREGIGRSAQKQTLLTAVGKRVGVRKAQERLLRGMVTEKRVVVTLNSHHVGPPDGGSRSAWLGDQVENFAAALRDYRGDLA